MSDPLRDARAKLDRANFHLEVLRSQITSVGDGERYAVPLIKDSDEDSGDLHLRMPGIPDIPKSWGLTIGDALHNFRSALDAVWWQLATAHLRREPSEDEAGKIQFPLSKPGGSFDVGTARKWVGDAAAKFAEELQPDKRWDAPDRIDPVYALRRLSNVDKHRKINAVALIHGGFNIGVRWLGTPLPDDESPMSLPGSISYPVGEDGPKEGDKVLTIPADSWIRRPDVEFDALQAAFISVDGKSDVLYLLDLIRSLVALAIGAATALLEGRMVRLPEKERVDTDHIPGLRGTPGAAWEKIKIPNEIGPLKPWEDEEGISTEKG